MKVRWIIFAILLLVLARFVLPLIIPSVSTIKEISSPDGKWLAIIAQQQDGVIFNPWYYTITLRPSGWLGRRWEKRILEEGDEREPIPELEWKDAHHINIRLKNPKDINLQVIKYDGINIFYEINKIQ